MFAAVDAGLNMVDMHWAMKCREEDLAQRALDNKRREIDDARRKVDEKAQQLKGISHMSTLIGGFAMIVLVEIQIAEDIDATLLAAFAGTTALVVGTMLVAMLNCTMILTVIMEYDVVTEEVPFEEFWNKHIKEHFDFSLNVFCTGTPLFITTLGFVGWVAYWQVSHRAIAASIVTCIAVVSLVYWFGYIKSRWFDYLTKGKQNKTGSYL
jgi:hypothetical protein